jgi:hypothetical protein
MKKFTKILSIALVFAMLALALVSCGATKEERVATAMAKMATATKVDYKADVKYKMTMDSQEVDTAMSMVVKSDLSDKENPVLYMLIEASQGGTKATQKMYYTDGYVYTDVAGRKFKAQMSYDKMMEENETSLDFTDIFTSKKDSIDESIAIKDNGDGTLAVEMIVTKEEFAGDFSDMVKDIVDSYGLSGMTIEVSDTMFQFTIDANNNITRMMAVMNMSFKYQGMEIKLRYDMDFQYNPVGENFEVPTPEDPFDYITQTVY